MDPGQTLRVFRDDTGTLRVFRDDTGMLCVFRDDATEAFHSPGMTPPDTLRYACLSKK